MGYNKRQFQKTNDKKVLHKVRKHWVVVSLAMLMALGGGALATHVSANADSTTANNGSNNGDLASRITQNMNQSKNTLVSASAQSNNNANASAQNANANNTSAQSNGNQSANNQSANNNQGSVNEQSIVKQASLLHQRILGNASQPRNLQIANQASQTADQNSNNNRQSNSGLGEVNANAPKRMLGASDNSDNASYTVRYYGTDPKTGHVGILGQFIYSDQSGNAFSNNRLIGWESDYPQANTYSFDPSAAGTYNGVKFDNQAIAVPNTMQKGNHTIDIALKPKNIQKGQIIVQYNNVSDNNAAVSSKVYSDLPGQYYTNLNADKSMVPTGFTLDTSDGTDGVISDGQNDSNASLSNPNGIEFHNGVATVKIAVTPSSSNANTENVVYEDAADNDVQVGGTQITGKKNQPLDVNRITGFTPTGYNLYTKKNPYGETASDGYNPKFKKGGTFNVEVVPNGVTPAKPGPEAGYSNATLNYVDETNGQLVASKQFQGKNSSDFEPASQGMLTTAPAGYTINGSDQLVNRNLNVSQTYGSKPVDQVAVKKIANYKPNKNATYNIEYDDVDNNNQQVGQLITETGKEGTPINYTNYTTLLPANSTFVGFGTHDANIVNNATEHILVKVAKNPANINVQYVDKNTGSDVSNGTIKGSDVNYGSDINVDNYKDKSGNQQSLLPAGYTPVANQNTSVKVNSDVHDLDVLVTGNKVSDTTPKGSSTKNQAPSVKIVPIEQWYDQSGHKESQKMTGKQVSLSGAKYDSDTSVNLDDYKPASDAQGNQYIADSADNNGKIMVDKNGNAGGSNHTVKLYYDRVSPLNVNFVNNETGNKVSSYVIKPSASDVNNIASHNNVSYDVTRGTDQTKPSDTAIPNGYSALANQQNRVLVHAMYPNTVNYMVEGNPVTVHYQVKRTTNGADHAPSDLSTVNKTSDVRVGDQITMDPSSKSYKPAGYTVDSSARPVTETVTPGANGSGQIAHNGTSFKYDATSDIDHVTPIEIKYVNQSGVEVAHKAVKGNFGDQINVVKPSDNGLSVPNGYSLANPDENTTYEFNGDQQYQTSDSNNGDYPSSDADHKGQLAQVDVVGNTISNGTVMYNVVSNEMSDGKVTNKTSKTNIHYNGVNGQPARVGDQIKINAGDYNPDSGSYEPTYSDAGAYFTVNGNGSVTPSNPVSDGNSALGLNYDIKQGYITVTYKDNNGNQVGNPETTNNDIGKPFDISSYENSPITIKGKTYTATGVVSDATQYTSKNQSPVVQVQRWDTANVQYKDSNTGKIVGSASYSGNPSDTQYVPSDYFKADPNGISYLPSGYKLDKNHQYNGPENLRNTTYTVMVTPDHSHVNTKPVKNPKIPTSDVGTITVYYVPSQYQSSNKSTWASHSTDHIVTYGDGVHQQGFSDSSYVNAMNGTGASDVNADSDSVDNVTNYASHPQSFYIFYNAPKTPQNPLKNNIRYLDEDNNNAVVATLPIYGVEGSKINYSDYENVVPSGYTFDKLGSVNTTFTGKGANNDILVRKSVPNQTYGVIQVIYKDNGQKVGKSDYQSRKTNTGYNAAQTINTVPTGYEFVNIEGGITSAPATFPTPDNPQTVIVDVKRAPAPYTVYNVRYMNGSNVVSQETVIGATNTLFNYSSYEDDIPSGYNYVNSNNVPTTFTNTDTTGDKIATPQNVNINVTPE